jgi:hypothetical protein
MESRDFSADSLASMGDAHSPLKPPGTSAHVHIPHFSMDSRLAGGRLASPALVSELSLPSRDPLGSAAPMETTESTMGSTPNASIPEGQPIPFENESRSASKSTSWMEMDSPRKPENASRPRGASDPFQEPRKKQDTPAVNPVLLRFISSAHLFDGAALETPEDPKPPKPLPSPEKQPLSPARSPTLLRETSLTRLQLSPSFKHKVGLERSLSSNLSLKKPIKLMPKPAPLPDAISPAQLARSDSDSPAFMMTAQGSPFQPHPEVPQNPARQDSSGSEAFSVGGQSSSSDGSGLHSMGSLNIFHQGSGVAGPMHSEYSVNQGSSAGGYGGGEYFGREDPTMSNSGEGSLGFLLLTFCMAHWKCGIFVPGLEKLA